jgi:hypothetical protein
MTFKDHHQLQERVIAQVARSIYASYTALGTLFWDDQGDKLFWTWSMEVMQIKAPKGMKVDFIIYYLRALHDIPSAYDQPPAYIP